MSNTPRASMAAIPEYNTPVQPKQTKKDWQPFKIDGELFYMRQPKVAVIARAANVLESGVPVDDPRNFRVLLQFCHQMIGWVVEEKADEDGTLHGRARIYERLDDPDDDFDLHNLMPPAQDMLKRFTDRPTGSPPASPASRRPTPAKRASAAGTRTGRAKTSTTRTRSSR